MKQYIIPFLAMVLFAVSIPSMSKANDLTVDENCANNGNMAEFAMQQRLNGASMSSILLGLKDPVDRAIIETAYEDQDARIFFNTPHKHPEIIRNFRDFWEQSCYSWYENKRKFWHIVEHDIDQDTLVIAVNDKNNFAYPLFIGCRRGVTEAWINWNMKIGKDNQYKKPVNVFIDENEKIFKPWGFSPDKQSTFFPGKIIPFLKELRDSREMIIQTTNMNGDKITASFNTYGGETLFDEMAQTCDWPSV